MRLLKLSTVLMALASLVLASTATVAAAGNKAGGAPAKTSAPKTTGPKAPKSAAPKTTGPKAPKAVHSNAKASPSAPKKSSTTTQAAKSSTVAPSTTTDFTTTPLGQKLSRNSSIRSKLETRLQALGYTGTVYQAAYGFKNQGQLMASVNNAQHLGISFDQLKLQMTGYTVAANGTILRANLNPDGTISLMDPKLVTNPAPTKSLGQAKQALNTAPAPSTTDGTR